jgi:FkbM family methyltransferase
MPTTPAPVPPPEAAHQLRGHLRESPAVYLYGAGSIGRDVLGILSHAGVTVRGVLDAKDGAVARLADVPVRKPDDPQLTPAVRHTATVVISIFNAFVDVPALQRRLTALGWGRVVGFTDFFEAFATELGDRYWLTTRGYYSKHGEQLAAARALLADEKSREVFDAIMRFRLSGDYGVLPPPELSDQYFPHGLPAWSPRLRLVDCGAFDGDTLRQVRALGLKLEAYAGFEPDPANFAKLAHEAAVRSGEEPGITALWPCGVWREVGQLRFSKGQGAGSAIDAGGETMIQGVSLDEALPNFAPNLIKMDIEGAEPAALAGARRMIQAHRPGLAVCVYHEPAHLWEIPLLINQWQLGYRFYLRCHQHSGFDLVLYARPA